MTISERIKAVQDAPKATGNRNASETKMLDIGYAEQLETYLNGLGWEPMEGPLNAATTVLALRDTETRGNIIVHHSPSLYPKKLKCVSSGAAVGIVDKFLESL